MNTHYSPPRRRRHEAAVHSVPLSVAPVDASSLPLCPTVSLYLSKERERERERVMAAGE